MTFSISGRSAWRTRIINDFNCTSGQMLFRAYGLSTVATWAGSAYLSWNNRLTGSSSAQRPAVAANSSRMASFFISISSLIDEPDDHDIRIVGKHLDNQLLRRGRPDGHSTPARA